MLSRYNVESEVIIRHITFPAAAAPGICPRHNAGPAPSVAAHCEAGVSHVLSILDPDGPVPEASVLLGEHRPSLWHSRNGNRSPPCSRPVKVLGYPSRHCPRFASMPSVLMGCRDAGWVPQTSPCSIGREAWRERSRNRLRAYVGQHRLLPASSRAGARLRWSLPSAPTQTDCSARRHGARCLGAWSLRIQSPALLNGSRVHEGPLQ